LEILNKSLRSKNVIANGRGDHTNISAAVIAAGNTPEGVLSQKYKDTGEAIKILSGKIGN
jgi:hypothetical protein